MTKNIPALTLHCSSAEDINLRLDKFLFKKFPTYSRSFFQEIIEQGLVRVNDRPVLKSSYPLKQTDTITLTFPPPKDYNLTPTQVAFDIVDVQPDFIVVNKPAGLVVHSSESNKDEISLVNGLLFYFQDLKNLVDVANPQRPGIVHRLDRNTSGLLLVARHQEAQIRLATMFRDRQIHKTYLAVVHGHPDKTGTINLPIGRSPTARHKMTSGGIVSRTALTHFKVLAYYPTTSLLALTIVTGRTHQIRVHCTAIGHPVVGDTTYGTASHDIARQALHAWHLSFTYQDKEYSYTQPLPKDIKQLIQKLRKQTS
jgi:23S rRNA pseudouridine1911/1915/1917 synthase